MKRDSEHRRYLASLAPAFVAGHVHSHRWRKIALDADRLTREARASAFKLLNMASTPDERVVAGRIYGKLFTLGDSWSQARGTRAKPK